MVIPRNWSRRAAATTVVALMAGVAVTAGGAATSSSCTQIIGDTVTFTGNSSVAINCSSYKTRPFGPTSLRLAS